MKMLNAVLCLFALVAVVFLGYRLLELEAGLSTKLDRDQWPDGQYVILQGASKVCPRGFEPVEAGASAVASFLPDPGGTPTPSDYIKRAHFGASSITCHGGDNCAAYVRPSPMNINFLTDIKLVFCVKG